MSAPAEPPNILLVLTEQQRGDCLGCAGHPVLLTPNMDEIAANGARFSRFYSDCPVCMPARRTILSGQFPATHGLLGNADGVEWQPRATLPGVLRENGYQTRWIGRSMHQFPKHARFGFDEVENGSSGGDTEYGQWLRDHAPTDSGGWHGGGVMHNDWTARPWHLAEHLHNTNWTVQRALDFLRRRDPTAPFFLTLSFLAAHPPLQPPEFYLNRYLRTGVPEPAIGDWTGPPPAPFGVSANRVNLEGEALLSARAAYYGLINHLDDQLRRVLNPVTGIRHQRDTIVCLTSDHGEMLGDHYRWHKNVVYESSARVPFLISGPPQTGIVPRTVCDTPATLADLMPTLLDLAGIGIPSSVDGCSLAPVLRGESAPDREFVHIENRCGMQAITDGKWKYIWHVKSGEEQVFHLEKDPTELRDLANSPTAKKKLPIWRKQLAQRLADRPEGFVRNGKLTPGAICVSALPHAGPQSTFSRLCFQSF